jgi:hypothetical protein
MSIHGTIQATDNPHVTYFTGFNGPAGFLRGIDALHQAGINGYILAGTTRLSTDLRFTQGLFLSRGDMTLVLTDWTYSGWSDYTDGTYIDGVWGFRNYNPSWINYSVWHMDYDSSQYSLVGYRYRQPITDNVGQYYAPMVVPSPPGHYELRWRYQKTGAGTAQEIRAPFTSVSRGVDPMRDY